MLPQVGDASLDEIERNLEVFSEQLVANVDKFKGLIRRMLIDS